MSLVKHYFNYKKSYYKWGRIGTKYYYIPNDIKSREKAKLKAIKEGKKLLKIKRLKINRFDNIILYC